MTSASELDPTTFEPPGPGSWMLDAVHVSRPFSRFQTEIHTPNLREGFREGARRYGLLIDTLDWRFVNGFAYFAVPPAPDEEVPARFAAAEEALERKLWREDMERWEREVSPAAIRAHLGLQAVDPRMLSSDELLEHLDRCREHQQRMIRQHHVFTVPAVLPVGDFIAHVGEWTGLPLGEFLALMRGAAPESAGAFPELDSLAAAIRENADAQTVLRADDAADVLDRLRSQPGEVGSAAVAYLDIVGFRLLDSLDTGDPYALEVPEVLVNGIRLAVDSGAPASSEASGEELARVRARVPAEHRDAFDALLAEARGTSKLRDERGLYSEVWAGGITRRAILAAGERLAESGRIGEPAHLVEAGYEEMRALMRGLDGPSAEELAGRASYRATYRAGAAPPWLGSPPQPPPPLDGLPPPVARLMRALVTAIHALFGGSEVESEATVVRGIGASPGVVSGTARVIGNPTELDRLQRGDVLVTTSTTESFNIVLPILGAIVTDTGGLLSHAAIVSREYGIPAVVGCRDATALIADGAQVRVDGTSGEVTVIAPVIAVPLADARDERTFGGKAVQLGAAIRAGLPVPDGFALAAALVEAAALGGRVARATLDEIGDRLIGPLAVRSSAIGEDSAAASFAGQHATVLNVCGVAAIAEALESVWRSAWTESALAYRRRVGVEGPVRVGVVIQRLVAADVAGVLFTRNPITGADELVIEASWGLGETVVQGLVVPDLYRVARTGEVLERRPGAKEVAVRRLADGGTRAEPVEPELVGRLCLADAHLRALSRIALRCDEVFGRGPHDVEWAFEAAAPYLLQRRPIAATKKQPSC